MKLQMAPNKQVVVDGQPAPQTFSEALAQGLDRKRIEGGGDKEFGITIGTKLWLGRKIGLKHAGVISHWTACRHLPNKEFMQKVCDALDLDYEIVRKLPCGQPQGRGQVPAPEIVHSGSKTFMIRAGRTYLLEGKRWVEIEIDQAL